MGLIVAIFKEIPARLASRLVAFGEDWRNKVGDAVTIDGLSYVMTYRHAGKNKFFRSRGISIYFHVGRSIIRLSDHWSQSNNFPKSKKMNCGIIGSSFIGYDNDDNKLYSRGVRWSIDNKTKTRIMTRMLGGRYPSYLMAGICGLTVLNKECDHWKK